MNDDDDWIPDVENEWIDTKDGKGSNLQLGTAKYPLYLHVMRLSGGNWTGIGEVRFFDDHVETFSVCVGDGKWGKTMEEVKEAALAEAERWLKEGLEGIEQVRATKKA